MANSWKNLCTKQNISSERFWVLSLTLALPFMGSKNQQRHEISIKLNKQKPNLLPTKSKKISLKLEFQLSQFHVSVLVTKNFHPAPVISPGSQRRSDPSGFALVPCGGSSGQPHRSHPVQCHLQWHTSYLYPPKSRSLHTSQGCPKKID